jgi:DNA helicase-2/ATP-dependent DNA helicase PcrA
MYIDFGSMILLATELLQKHSDLRKKYQSIYRYVIIDEFQDTSGNNITDFDNCD